MEPPSDPFTNALLQLLDEERSLRALAEERVRGYLAVLLDLALIVAPEEIERRRRLDPYFPSNQDPAGWRELVQSVRAGRLPAAASSWAKPAQAVQSAVAVAEQASAEAVAPPGSPRGGAAGTPFSPAVPAIGSQPSFAVTHASSGPRLDPERPHPGSRLRVTLPPVPPVPPAQFADAFNNWEREGLALVAIAATGWSNRMSLADLMGERLGIASSSGSIKRLFDALTKAGFCRLQPVQYSAAPPQRTYLFELTEQGREVAAACGIKAQPPEWERLLAHLSPGSQGLDPEQMQLAAFACAFTHHARSRGYRAEILPYAAGESWPDVEVMRDGADYRVALCLAAGEEGERVARWQYLAEQTGCVAFCTPGTALRSALSAEARTACERGRATDLEGLIAGRDSAALWLEEW